ncbi:DUF4843 domain-containing protein [Algoriphagus sp. A40]|uniref:DUF4843 domain-containing protein n=1 Tax=Algoriphagus sp. A40 TaxID=1945863 RepID=UPI00143C1701|nr:DUF4843 domain-containing protein [Algoriphagus sp. A40]
MKKLYIYFAVVFAAIAMTSCFDDPGAEAFFEGNQVEFNAGALPNGLTSTLTRTSGTQTDILQVQVNRVSTSATAAITVNIAVDPTSTAVKGVHYSLASNSLTIPAGEFVGNFPVTILTGNIQPTEAPVLKLVIDSATGAELSPNYADLSINIKVVCTSAISTNADVWVATTSTIYGNFTKDVTFKPLPNGQYTVSDVSAGMYAAFGFSGTQEVIYGDNCGKITFVRTGQVEFAITNPASGETVGAYDAAAKTVTLYWADVPNDIINAKTTLVKK